MNTESQSNTNPFLIGGFENVSQSTDTIFNPFDNITPSNIGTSATFSSNPFLQNITSTSANESSFSSPFNASTNPFAQFFGSEQNIGIEQHEEVSIKSITPQSEKKAIPVSDLVFDNNVIESRNYAVKRDSDVRVESSFRRASTSSMSDKRSPPRRPPPPRPSLPKETKDLIMSVTGALEATSSDLLDRLQATRTPSPTPLRELNSPSPTNITEINDLLGDDDIEMPRYSHGETTHTDNNIQQEALNIFDAIANLSKEEEDKLQIHEDSSVLHEIPQKPAVTMQQLKSQTVSIMPPSRPPPPQLPILHMENRLENVLDKNDVNVKILSQNELNTIDDSDIQSASLINQSNSNYIQLSSTSVSSGSIFSSVSDDINKHALEFSIKPSLPLQTDSQSSFSYVNRKTKGEPTLTTDYVATRKTSHDLSAVTSTPFAIPPRKKYSLDYSNCITDPNAINQFRLFNSNQTETTSTTAVISTTSTSTINNYCVTMETIGETDTKNQIFEDNTILEVPKFPVISTTPLISCENITNENLYEPSDTREHLENDTNSYESQLDTNMEASFVNTMKIPFESNSLFSSTTNYIEKPKDDFDIFEEKFKRFGGDEKQISGADPFDPFGDSAGIKHNATELQVEGFGNESTFDEFLTSNHLQPAFNENIHEENLQFEESFPTSEIVDNTSFALTKPVSFSDIQPFPNVFNATTKIIKTDSSETPPTPLFDEDVSQPLEPFPRTVYNDPGWNMQIRYPIRKKFTGQRFWKKVFVRLVYQGDTPHLELVNKDEGKETLHHEWPLQPCYAISDIGTQQYDQYGKIFTVKVQFVIYKERPGVRPGQVTKAERLTNKLSQFAAYAIQGDYQGVKEFGSDLKKLGLPVEHSPQISLICKLGSHNYEDMKQFTICIEDALFKLQAHRDNIHINYKMEEVQITAVDELYIEQNANGSVLKQIARVRLFFLGFLTGMPDIEIGVNDLRRQGKEIVGRHDIIPVVTEEWIRLENVEFHSCIQQDVYEETKIIKFKPPDACYLELIRFRVRPPKNRELPLQLKTVFRMCGNKVDILADIMVPGFTSRKLGQIPCEDVAVRIPIPECWIYLFRIEKHFRYGSVKSAHRRTGKIKGIERFLGAVDALDIHLIEVTSGHAKYEHHHRSIVWRMSRLPKEGQGAYTSHSLVCHLALTSYDQIPEELAKYCYVEFTMPVTQVSHTTVRSVSISNSDSDSPPEKYVRHLARHEYKVEIEHTHSEGTNEYIAATTTKPKVEPPRPVQTVPEPAADSDSDSD